VISIPKVRLEIMFLLEWHFVFFWGERRGRVGTTRDYQRKSRSQRSGKGRAARE